MTWSTLPLPIRAFLIADLAVGLLYVINHLAGTPMMKVNRLVNLDDEANLPTWYSSMQWAATAALFLFAGFRMRVRDRAASLAVIGLGALLLMLSLDEVAQIHEKLSIGVSQRAGAGQGRWKGMWLPALGIPVLLVAGLLVRRAQRELARVPHVITLIIAGFAIFGLGAFGVEPILNIASTTSGPVLVWLEETLEMVGVTVLLAGAYQLAMAEGLSKSL